MKIKFSSANLAEGEYVRDERRLRITFKNGAVYDYFEVDESTVTALMNASSQGGYFAQSVKNVFRSERVQ